jgi:Uma2 family endonuclease
MVSWFVSEKRMPATSTQSVDEVLPPTDLLEEDGVPLESDWHRLAMTLLIELVGLHLAGREDYFVGGNMFIYFDARQARDRHFRGPDFFFVWEVPLNPPRKYWAVWDEGGKYPDVIIELSSPTTASEDHGVKKTTYEKVFHTHEYFIYDPAEGNLQGWRLNGQGLRYHAIQPDDRGWLWSAQLGLWLGPWEGRYQQKQEVYLRFFDKDGILVASAQETAEAEKQRAEAEKQRADAAEAMLQQLIAQQKLAKP